MTKKIKTYFSDLFLDMSEKKLTFLSDNYFYLSFPRQRQRKLKCELSRLFPFKLNVSEFLRFLIFSTGIGTEFEMMLPGEVVIMRDCIESVSKHMIGGSRTGGGHLSHDWWILKAGTLPHV